MMDDVPMLAKISDYVALHARETPDAEALVLGDRRVDYAAFKRAADALARALIAAGVEPGDRVATLQTPTPEFAIAFVAASSIGAIWMGLNPKYRAAELEYVVGDARPAILLTRLRVGERDYSEEIVRMRAAAPELREVVGYEGEDRSLGVASYEDFLARGRATSADELARRQEAAGGGQACLLVYTSGSTGRPKGALLHHEGIVRFSLAQNDLWPIAPYRSLNFLPINHIGCTVDLTAPCLAAGGAIIFMEHFDAARSVRLVERERLTMVGSVPSVFALQAATPEWERTDFSSVQLLVWEGAAISADLLERLAAKCPRLATNYGMSETTSAIAAIAPTDDRDLLLHSVGSAFAGVELRLADETGADVGIDAVGEVQSRSGNNFLGYWNRPDATAEAFTADGYFRTGDLARRRPDGRIQIVGRLKEMYKSGGYNVYPREIEDRLEEHPAVAAAAVVGVDDPLWGQIGVAFVQARAPVTPPDLDAWCRVHLANYKVPKRICLMDEMPLLPIGKIDKSALRRRAGGMDDAKS